MACLSPSIRSSARFDFFCLEARLVGFNESVDLFFLVNGKVLSFVFRVDGKQQNNLGADGRRSRSRERRRAYPFPAFPKVGALIGGQQLLRRRVEPARAYHRRQPSQR